MQQFELTAQPRQDLGKGASRRLRRQGLIPAIIYGAGQEPMSLTLNHNELLKSLQQEAFYSHILTVNINDQPEKAVLKDLQRHPYRPVVLHADFQRVSETKKITMHVPLHFLNEEKCMGVKQGGGMVSRQLAEVEIRCLPRDLPEYLEVDLSEVKLNQIIHLSDLALPPGVELVALFHGAEYNLPVVSVHLPRTAHVEEEAQAAAVPAEGETQAAAPPAKPAK